MKDKKKNKKNKDKALDVPISHFDNMFKTQTKFSIGVSYETYRSQVYELFNLDIGKDNTADGTTSVYVFDDGKITWIWCSTRNPALIAHEVTHLVQFALDDIEVKLTNNTQEIYAYMTEYYISLINYELDNKEGEQKLNKDENNRIGFDIKKEDITEKI